MPEGYQLIQLILTGLVFPGIYLFLKRITNVEEKLAVLFERREHDQKYLHEKFVSRDDFYRVVGDLKQTIADSHRETREAISHKEVQVNNLSSEIFTRLGAVQSAIDKHTGEKHDGE